MPRLVNSTKWSLTKWKPVPAPVAHSLVAQAGAAGAVAASDGSASVTWQPGAVPTGSTLTFDRTGAV